MKDKNNTPFGGPSYYETGSTTPPKSHNGCIIIPLTAVIILGSILTVMGILNIRLFTKGYTHPDRSAIGFDTVPTEAADAPDRSQTEIVEIPLDTVPAVTPQSSTMPYQDIYAKLIPSVVSVLCDTGAGNGIILTADGYIVTNCQIVEGAAFIEVLLHDGSLLPATLIGTDTATDLAVLRIAASELTPIPLGDSREVRTGDPVAAIGDHLGTELRGNMTNGIITGIRESDGSLPLLINNATLPGGNMGGPLVNYHGQVIGIHTMALRPAGLEAVSCAIPSVTVKNVTERLIRTFTTGRPTLGLTGNILSTLDAIYYRLPHGFYISDVLPDSDAARKGIRPGDVLTNLDGQPVTDINRLLDSLHAHQAGDAVSVTIYRDGRYISLTVTLTLTEPTG